MELSSHRVEASAEIRFVIRACSLGLILIAHSPLGVCTILMGEDAEVLLRDLQTRFRLANIIAGDQDSETLAANVVDFIETPAKGFDFPLDMQGTVFQKKVWQALREIPAGKTASYADIARRIGTPKAFRAVAQACAANPIAVLVPCHRVVRSDGALSGFRWGVARKSALLALEATA
jgi:AraC family transcriptional regulator, regulatory protein of adaptative response / methylated-DNA-[protein]-cysteine methyltransferase